MKAFEGYKAEQPTQKMMLPAGCYVATIKNIKLEGSEPDQQLKLMVDISEGEFSGFYTRQYDQAKSGNSQYEAKYKGVYSIQIPNSDNSKRSHPEWDLRTFNNAMWCIEQSNPGYHWDWNEAGLKNKVIGINVREGVYNGNPYTKIGRFEVADDVCKGICKVMKPLKETGTPTNANDTPDGFSRAEEEDIPF